MRFVGTIIFVVVITGVSLGRAAEMTDEHAQVASTEPSTQPTTQPSLFFDSKDGYFDVSNFLSTRVGFLPIAMPITEPATGYGLSLGLSFFHDKPKVVNYPGQPSRVIMPDITAVFGASTEGGTWAVGLGQISNWNDGKIRYVGALGYTHLDLDWYGQGDSLGDNPIAYTNDVWFLYQKVTFKIADSNFFIGPQYRFITTDANFSQDSTNGGIPESQLESKTAGLGAIVAYDTLDKPFAPTNGVRAEVSYSQQAEAFGGDFNYGRLGGFAIGYVPINSKFVLGLRADTSMITGGGAPFYDLPSIMTRGIPRGKYVDNSVLTTEAELDYALTPRWTMVGFAGLGRVADSFGDLGSADNHTAVGAGFRYLVARQYDLPMGVDVGYGDDGDWTVYITMGTGWVRP